VYEGNDDHGDMVFAMGNAMDMKEQNVVYQGVLGKYMMWKMLGPWIDMCFLLIGGYERKRYVNMRCITKLMRGDRQYGVYVVDKGYEGYLMD
jgi:hypothetical protein